MISLLAVSDARSWFFLKDIIEKEKPDITIFCGDIVDDGVAKFWQPSWEIIQKIIKENKLKSYSILSDYDLIHEKYFKSKEFVKARRAHVKELYDALELASKKSKQVLVIKGNHDDEFSGAYNLRKIEHIKNCSEISGKLFSFKGIRFLGLSYKNCHYLTELRSLLGTSKPHIIISHPEKNRWKDIAEYGPDLVIHGHHSFGFHKVGGVNFLGTGCFPSYSIVKIDEKSKLIKEIKHFRAIPAKEKHNISKGFVAFNSATIVEKWILRTVKFD